VQGGDFVNGILAVHNQERDVVGVPPLTWSDTVAASAQAWADSVLAGGELVHSTGSGYGESIAAWGLGGKTPAQLAQTWADEKSKYVPGTTWSFANGHYTAMVDKKSTEVGCGLASGPAGPDGQKAWDVLVCQYNPPGNGLEPPY